LGFGYECAFQRSYFFQKKEKMKKILVLSLLLFFTSQIELVAGNIPPLDRWSLAETWTLGNRPLDFARSLDRKYIFVLGETGEVIVYSTQGDALGVIPVGPQALALAIEPRGQMLYVISKNKTYTALRVSISAGTLNWSIQNRWQTEAVPVDFVYAHDKSMVFVLEEDSVVRVYAPEGKRIGSIPVAPGTIALDFVPRQKKLYLVNQNNTYTALDLLF
jgi:DNA-binding beta-propeller fold protein YncE